MEPTPFEKAKQLIQSADVLQYRAAPWLYRGVSIPQKVVSKYIATAGRSLHSHSGLAVRIPPVVADAINSGKRPKQAIKYFGRCGGWFGFDESETEFFSVQMLVKGGSCDRLEDEVNRYPGLIDVYRPKAAFYVPPIGGETIGSSKRYLEIFNRFPVCSEMLNTVASNGYGKMNVFVASLQNLPGFRWIVRPSRDDGATRNRRPHCSHAVSRAFRRHYVDPVPARADHDTIPGDLSTSLLFDHVMRLVP